jgi:uncharacterized cupredoxin-like copper-binding protein
VSICPRRSSFRNFIEPCHRRPYLQNFGTRYKKVITLDKATLSIEAGKTGTITVSNASELEGLKVVSGTPATATVAIDKGVATITAVSAGETVLTFSATNAKADVTATITVTAPAAPKGQKGNNSSK